MSKSEISTSKRPSKDLDSSNSESSDEDEAKISNAELRDLRLKSQSMKPKSLKRTAFKESKSSDTDSDNMRNENHKRTSSTIPHIPQSSGLSSSSSIPPATSSTLSSPVKKQSAKMNAKNQVIVPLFEKVAKYTRRQNMELSNADSDIDDPNFDSKAKNEFAKILSQIQHSVDRRVDLLFKKEYPDQTEAERLITKRDLCHAAFTNYQNRYNQLYKH